MGRSWLSQRTRALLSVDSETSPSKVHMRMFREENARRHGEWIGAHVRVRTASSSLGERMNRRAIIRAAAAIGEGRESS